MAEVGNSLDGTGYGCEVREKKVTFQRASAQPLPPIIDMGFFSHCWRPTAARDGGGLASRVECDPRHHRSARAVRCGDASGRRIRGQRRAHGGHALRQAGA